MAAPTDEQILAHSQAVHDAAIQDTPFISARLPIAHLAEEYRNGNPVIQSKIAALASDRSPGKDKMSGPNISHYYKSRGDGNCFYRAFAFGLLRQLTSTDASKNNELQKDLVHSIDASCKLLEEVGFSKLVYEDFLEPLQELIASTNMREDWLLQAMNDAERSNAIVVYLRFITSAYIKLHRDLYSLYMTDGEILDRWCERWVEAMDAEADNIQINALVNAIHVGVDVVTLDGTKSKQDDDIAQVLQVRPDEGKEAAVVSVLYRPGHYDVLA